MKQKKLVFFFILINTIFITKLSAQFFFLNDGHYIGRETGYRFIEPNIVHLMEYKWGTSFYGIDTYEIAKTGRYTIVYDNNVPFINIQWDNNTSDRYLILATGEFLCLYNNNSDPYFFGRKYDHPWDYGLPWYGHVIEMEDVSASSTLREGNNLYAATPERLGTRINSVWAVEGGENEKLFITKHIQTVHLYLSIGYVHFLRPYLYLENSRPKRIRVSFLDDPTNFIDYELEDNPNYQTIDFPISSWRGINMQNIVIEILEICPGTRYNHTCINSILRYWSQ